jgi:undecaprenyl-diphosphatase
MLHLDEQIFRWLYGGHASGPVAMLMVIASVIGSGWSMLAFIPLFFAERTRRFAAALTAVLCLNGALVFLLKAAVGRVRPFRALGVDPLWGAPSDFSFPSGHAAGSFAFAAFVVTVWLGSASPSPSHHIRAACVAVVSIALLIAISRVYLGVHFPGDVFAGAVLGSLVGWGGARLYRARISSPSKDRNEMAG